MSTPLQLGSEVHAIRENVVGRTADHDFHFIHPGQKLEVISLGCGLAICRPSEAAETDLVSIQVADLEIW
jgi:hypothetical protein